VLLLAPSPPMLFMGEEFAAATPFQFFCDFQGELAHAVTDGRRREFAGFDKFKDPAVRALIPDPNEIATFARCKLDWACLDQPQHKVSLDYYRNLLVLRKTAIVPRLSGMDGGASFKLIGATGLVVFWRLGDGARLTLLANLGDCAVEGALHFTGTAIYLSQPDLHDIFATGQMSPWSVAWFIEEIRP
jgi:1,4-alpha-glucan branching enzyme/maltooligosyltrehalose trehalohydrolase